MKRLKDTLGSAIIAATLVVAPLSAANAQRPSGPPALVSHQIATGTYWIEGDAANTGFVVGRDGVVVIDTQRSADVARLQIAQIARVTPKPVKTIIVTHGDPDHVGGLMAYSAGSTIIAHENTRAQILATAREPDGTSPSLPTYRAIAAERLPNRTIGSTETIMADGVVITLLHVAPAHSSGDLVVFLPRQKVAYVGDLLTVRDGTFPIIHVGGSSEGWIRTLRAVLSLKADTFVAGHGGLMTRQELRTLLQQVEERREAIKALAYQGKSIAEINAALPEAKTSPMFLSFNETTYFELMDGYPDAQPPWASLAPNDHRRRKALVH